MKYLLLALLILNAHAEVQLQFFFFNAPSDAPKEVMALFNRKSEPLPVKLPKRFFSPTVKIPTGVKTLYFLPSEYKIGKELPEGMPSINIPKGAQKLLVLASPDKANSLLPIKFITINANDDTFGRGDLMFINSTTQAIAGNVGSKELKLSPKKFLKLRKPAKSGETYPVELNSYTREGEKQLLVKRNWQYSDITRQLIFFYHDEHRKKTAMYAAPVYGM